MRKIVLFVLVLLTVLPLLAQDTKPETKPAPPRNDFSWARTPYRLEFVIKELDDSKVINSRAYSIITQSTEERGRTYGEVKAGSRVPVITTSKEGASTTQYMDVGVNIGANLNVMENSNLLLTAAIEISSLADVQSGANPIVRQIRTNTTGEVTAGKSNQIATVDDPTSKHRFAIDVTVTKLR